MSCAETDQDDIELLNFTPSEEQIKIFKNRLNQLNIPEQARLILIYPGGPMIPLRNWPTERFIELTKLLLEDDLNYVFLVGNKENYKINGLLKEGEISFFKKNKLEKINFIFNIAENNLNFSDIYL